MPQEERAPAGNDQDRAAEAPELDHAGVREAGSAEDVAAAPGGPGPEDDESVGGRRRLNLGDRFEWIDEESENLFRFTYNISSKSWQAKCMVHEPDRVHSGGLTYCTRSRRAPTPESYEEALAELKQWCKLAPTCTNKDEHQGLPRPQRRARRIGRGARGHGAQPRRESEALVGDARGSASGSAEVPEPSQEAEPAQQVQPASSDDSSSSTTSSSTGEESGNSSSDSS